MYEILRHTHGGFRYLLLLAIVLALFSFVTGWTRNRDFTAWDKRAALSVLILSHLQLVTGLVLYFISPSNYPNELAGGEANLKLAAFRYFAVEHLVMMLLAIALITIGYSKAKRVSPDFKKFKILLWTYLSAVLIISISLFMKMNYDV